MCTRNFRRIIVLLLLLLTPALFSQNVVRKVGRKLWFFKETFLENTTKRVIRRELAEEAFSQGCKSLLRTISVNYKNEKDKKRDKSFDLSRLVAGGGLEPPTSGL